MSDLLGEFRCRIYEAPLSDLRESGGIRDISNPIAVLMLAIDFLTEVEMNGITNFIGNSTGEFAIETVGALKELGCKAESSQLAEILSIASAAGMTHHAIQQDRLALSEFEVTSFVDTHGDKWDATLNAIEDAESRLSYGSIYSALEPYCQKHIFLIEAALVGS